MNKRINTILGLILTILTISSLFMAAPVPVGAADAVPISMSNVTNTSCTVSWVADASATNYQVFANTVLQNNPATAASSAGVNITYTAGALTANISGLLIDKAYYFSVFVLAPAPAKFLTSIGLSPRDGYYYLRRQFDGPNDPHIGFGLLTGLNGLVVSTDLQYIPYWAGGVGSAYGYGRWYLNDGTETTYTVDINKNPFTAPKYDWFYFHQDFKLYSDAACTKEIGSRAIFMKYYGATYSDVSMRGGTETVNIFTITDPTFLGKTGTFKTYGIQRPGKTTEWTVMEGYGNLAGLTGAGTQIAGPAMPYDPNTKMLSAVNVHYGYYALPVSGFYAQIQHSRTTATVNWAPLAGATSYKVVVNTTPQPNFATAVNGSGIVVSANSGLTSAEVSGITFNTPYYVSVWATAPNTVPLGCSDFTVPRPFFWWWWW